MQSSTSTRSGSELADVRFPFGTPSDSVGDKRAIPQIVPSNRNGSYIMYVKLFHLIATLAVLAATLSTNAMARETLKDRCGKEVSIPMSYDGKPGQEGAIVLQRPADGGWTSWSEPFTVELSPEGRVRWWCHSETGNFALSGVYKLSGAFCKALGVLIEAKTEGPQGTSEATGGLCKKGADAWLLNPQTSQGWTAERSRCDDHSTKLRARVGPGRRLEMECLGR
jgi:hypothetical protein